MGAGPSGSVPIGAGGLEPTYPVNIHARADQRVLDFLPHYAAGKPVHRDLCQFLNKKGLANSVAAKNWFGRLTPPQREAVHKAVADRNSVLPVISNPQNHIETSLRFRDIQQQGIVRTNQDSTMIMDPSLPSPAPFDASFGRQAADAPSCSVRGDHGSPGASFFENLPPLWSHAEVSPVPQSNVSVDGAEAHLPLQVPVDLEPHWIDDFGQPSINFSFPASGPNSLDICNAAAGKRRFHRANQSGTGMDTGRSQGDHEHRFEVAEDRV